MLNHTDMTSAVLTAMTVAIVRAVGKRADLEDILNDSVVECLEKGEAFDAARGKVATFCAKLAGNVARNHVKAEGYRSHDVVTKGEEGEPTRIVDGLPGDDGRADALRTEEGQWLAMALATLTDEERAFIRAINQGMGQTEAGALVGWSPATSTRRRKAIAEKLAALR
jgi:DNA-directed RNA polymerase specialized sigma24 family protein